MKEKISITIDSKLLEKIDSIIDGISIRNRSQAIEFLSRSAIVEKRSAVILSGGDEKTLRLEDSFRPLGLIKNKTVVERAIRKFRDNNFKEIFIIARHKVLTAIFDILKDGS